MCVALQFNQKGYSQVMLFDRKVELTGTFSAQASVYTTNQDQQRMEPFTWRIYGNPRVRFKDFDIPMNLIIGSYEDRLRQAYNKFGMSPKYKELVVVHLGFRNVTFSPLTLGGKTMLGAGFELNIRKFRAGFMYGRFDRAVDPDSVSFSLPTFKRSGFAARIGYGTKSNYIDLVFLKAKDNENSLDQIPEDKPVDPAENAVIGLTVRQRLIKYFYFGFDAALSAYSRDSRSEVISDPDLAIGRIMQVFIPIRVSNQYMTALMGSLEYRRQQYTAGVEYHRIEPDFQSMGVFYIRNDLEKITLYGRFNALKNKLNGTARLGWQRNGVIHDRSSGNFQNIKSLDVNYLHKVNWVFTMSYSNFITRQTLELVGINDSTLLDQVIHNLGIGATYRQKSEYTNHTYSSMVSFQNNRDRANDDNQLVLSSFSLQLRYRIDLNASQFYLSPAFIFNNYRFTQSKTNRYSPSVIVGKSFYERKLNAFLNSGISFSNTDGTSQKTVFRNIVNISYKVMRKQTLSLRLSLANSRGNSGGSSSFSEFQGDVIYTISL
jgi:hypothetical protein